MDTLAHDPRTKSQIKDAIYEFLYNPVNRQFKTRIDTLITRNAILGGFSHKHFVYKGVMYNGDTTNPPTKKNRLLPALRPEMDEYLRDKDRLNHHELPFVVGFITQVLNASDDFHDYLRVLPESVHAPLHRLLTTCPCRNHHLTEDKVAQLQTKNQASIDLMKARLVTNLLI